MCSSAAGSPDGERGEGGEEGGEKVPSFQEAFTEALLTAQVSTIQGMPHPLYICHTPHFPLSVNIIQFAVNTCNFAI